MHRKLMNKNNKYLSMVNYLLFVSAIILNNIVVFLWVEQMSMINLHI